MTYISEFSHDNNTNSATSGIFNGQDDLFDYGHWNWAVDPEVAFEKLKLFPQSVNATVIVWDKEDLSKAYWVDHVLYPISGVNYVNPDTTIRRFYYQI